MSDGFLRLLEASQRGGVPAPALLTFMTLRAVAHEHPDGTLIVHEPQAVIANRLQLDRRTICGHVTILRTAGWLDAESPRGRYPRIVLIGGDGVF